MPPLSEALNVAWAEHEMSAEPMPTVLRWFAALRQQSVQYVSAGSSRLMTQ